MAMSEKIRSLGICMKAGCRVSVFDRLLFQLSTKLGWLD
jgi:hypothetical protein